MNSSMMMGSTRAALASDLGRSARESSSARRRLHRAAASASTTRPASRNTSARFTSAVVESTFWSPGAPSCRWNADVARRGRHNCDVAQRTTRCGRASLVARRNIARLASGDSRESVANTTSLRSRSHDGQRQCDCASTAPRASAATGTNPARRASRANTRCSQDHWCDEDSTRSSARGCPSRASANNERKLRTASSDRSAGRTPARSHTSIRDDRRRSTSISHDWLRTVNSGGGCGDDGGRWRRRTAAPVARSTARPLATR